MNVTLDTNCIYDLEEGEKPDTTDIVRASAAALRTLVTLHNDGLINLRVVATSGSENQMDKVPLSDFSPFGKRLVRLGLGHLEILKPIWHLGMSFLDHLVLANEGDVAIQRKIWRVLFPRMEPDYREYCVARGLDPDDGSMDRKWRKASCDVQIVWCHIRYDGNILVTRDEKDMIRRKDKLIDLGVGSVLRPTEAAARLAYLSPPR